ncbi:MAG: nuclear transport factor 2 family protein [Rhodanobacteraceae bacterium]|nr:nuclear transport factor 2 family protein [Rhodanobacteraceae bacterium]
MNTKELAAAFTEMLKAGQHDEAAARFNSPDIVSREAMEGPMAEVRGTDAVKAKGQWWYDNHEVHSSESFGPYVNGDQFAVRFVIDVTFKPTGERTQMDEVGVYTVKDGQIVEERFYY